MDRRGQKQYSSSEADPLWKRLQNRDRLTFLEYGSHSNTEYTVHADLIVGADGAHSTVRSQLQRHVKMYYEQTYINSLWCEFTIPPTKSGDFALPPNYLHIWPKQTYMFIAIPSIDRSFTCTLFMPEEMFNAITTPESVTSFFRTNFNDVFTIIGEKALHEQYFGNKHLPLVSVRTAPYHYKGRAVIIGDAAHAMVPFYGQGMNAGFESARILYEQIAAHPGDLERALDAYSKQRQDDAFAIVELAMRNYDEMRSGVTKKGYLLRKWAQEGLMKWAPWTKVQTLYSMVSFGNEGYSYVRKKAQRQEYLEEQVLAGIVISVLSVLGWKFGVHQALVIGAKAVWKALKERRAR